MVEGIAGRWHGELLGTPSGLLGSAAHHAPLLGNGYTGIVLSSNRSGTPLEARNDSHNSIDLWINSNANWDCQPSGARLPPADCSVRVLGGLSIATVGGDVSAASTELLTEQRLANGTLWTRRTGNAGSILETETYIDGTQNVVVTEVSYAGAVDLTVEATLFTYGPNAHVRATTRAACSVSPAPACSRRFHAVNASGFHAPWSALAMHSATKPMSVVPGTAKRKPSYEMEFVTSTFGLPSSVAPGRSISKLWLVVALADNLLGGNEDDPAPAAAALALGSTADDVKASSQALWESYWAASSVSLPSRPAIERMWYGAQYVTACMTPSASMHRRLRARAPPPGLYGPFTTSDFAFWNGDFTLDYNQQAAFYHVYSSNHPERAAAYFTPITDWKEAAAQQAIRVAASAGNLTCLPKALNYACHLAPWGAQSRDTSSYGQWNGAFASLLFINDWEYTRNETFARRVTLPLLDGINAWTACYLHNATDPSGGRVYEDWNAALPDQLFENHPGRNPLSGLSLFKRTAMAQRDIATALGLAYPPYLDDIIEHLVRPSLVAAPVYGAGDEAAGRPLHGRRAADEPPPPVWVAAEGYGWRNSSLRALGFSTVLFPLWPSELVSGLTADEATRAVAQASAKLYANLSCAGRPWPEPPFETCVDAGWGALTVFSAAVRALPGTDGEAHALSSREIADGLEGYVAAYGANATNLLAYAPGGGIEHVGMSHAVNEMLAQSDGEHIVLFPAWPPDEPAAFSSLRVKGAFTVSASWSHVERAAADVVIRATVAADCSLSWPWAQPSVASAVRRAQIECSGGGTAPSKYGCSGGGTAPSKYGCSGGGTAPSKPAQAARMSHVGAVEADDRGRLRWHMLAGDSCSLWPLPTASF